MTKMHENTTEFDRAILVGVGVGETITEADLDELSDLCKSCNIIEAGRIIQNRKDVDVTYYVGKGKVEEIKTLVENADATCVVFDVELSGSKVRNLEAELGVAVLDRSKVILDIFAMRAQSMEGKLQVELAMLKYNLPRLVGSHGLMSKMKTSVGMRGPGEKQLELDKRKIRDEILALEKRLIKLGESRDLNRKHANKSGKPRVCLVGYTNSGKSTLLNTLAKADVMAEDKLFATLDPKTANLYLQGSNEEGQVMTRQILLTDTVGFINKLPHEFIRAFESTLDEARYADLLLHVVDASNEHYLQQIRVVDEVLEKIGADTVPQILVLNKVDKLGDVGLKLVKQEFSGNYVTISAKENTNMEELKWKILTGLNAI